MPQLSLECPHCRTQKIGFAPMSATDVKPGERKALLFLKCEGCGQGLVAVIEDTAQHVHIWMQGQRSNPGPIQDTYPKMSAIKTPADVPPEVQRAFLSGMDNLSRAGGANAAAIMFRRAVEIAAKKINPNSPKEDNLKKRIDDLSPDIATPAMKEWAHHVRLDANEAAHEPEEFSEDDAKKLHVFAEMFLTYAYTLPAMLKRARDTQPP